MTPLDPINPVVPGKWVRRTEEKRRNRGGEQPRKDAEHTQSPPGKDPDGRQHIIDELA